MTDKLILDNYKLLDCYLSTGYLTSYLDQLRSYKPHQERYLPPGVRSKSELTNKGYRLAVERYNNSCVHLALLYLLLYIDKLSLSHGGTLELLQINNNKYKMMINYIRLNKLRSILRPSKPYIGLKHRRGYTPFCSGV